MNGCAPSLALMERLTWTRKWAILQVLSITFKYLSGSFPFPTLALILPSLALHPINSTKEFGRQQKKKGMVAVRKFELIPRVVDFRSLTRVISLNNGPVSLLTVSSQ